MAPPAIQHAGSACTPGGWPSPTRARLSGWSWSRHYRSRCGGGGGQMIRAEKRDLTHFTKTNLGPRRMNLNTKIALITGAGSGIGRACALALLREGFAVVLAGRRAEALEQTKALADSAGARVLAVPTDVGDASSVRALFDKTKQAFGRLDLLFNNPRATAPALPLQAFTS